MLESPQSSPEGLKPLTALCASGTPTARFNGNSAVSFNYELFVACDLIYSIILVRKLGRCVVGIASEKKSCLPSEVTLALEKYSGFSIGKVFCPFT